MTTRRAFVKRSIAAAASACLSRSFGQSEVGGTTLNFGYISGMVRDELKNDWRRVLAQTVDFGFTEIEISNPPGEASPEEFVAYCEEMGIKPVAGGVSMTEDAGELDAKLDGLAAIGIRYAVAYWPWFVGDPFSLEDCRRSARVLNEMGKVCAERDMTLCWHNHDHEFETMEQGGRAFDYLMNNTNERLVKCELDVYWAAKGGAAPVECLRQYAGRYALLHLKDVTADERRTFECVGDGILNFPAILKEARRQGIKHFMVEHDKVEDGLACLKSSGQYLRSLSI